MEVGVTAVDPNRSNQVNIPLSLQTFEIGDVPGGWSLQITYEAEFVATMVGFTEAAVMEFSDPLTVHNQGGEFPTITFTGPDAVAPAPAPLGLILTGAGLLLLGRFRQHRRCEHTSLRT